jgi:hypothetical protein
MHLESVVWKTSTGNIAQLSFDHRTNRGFLAVQSQRDQPLQRFGIRRTSLGDDLPGDLLAGPLKHGCRSGDSLRGSHRTDLLLVDKFDRRKNQGHGTPTFRKRPRGCEKMGLAPSGNGENHGKSAVAKVPVPIFSHPLRVPSAVHGTRSVPTTLELNNLFLRVREAARNSSSQIPAVKERSCDSCSPNDAKAARGPGCATGFRQRRPARWLFSMCDQSARR